jgi:hypothetical protein
MSNPELPPAHHPVRPTPSGRLPWPCSCSRHHRQQKIVRVLGVVVSTPVLVVEPVDATTYKAAKEHITAPPSHPLSIANKHCAHKVVSQCPLGPLGRPAVSSIMLPGPFSPRTCLKNMPPSQATSQSCPQTHRPQGRRGQASKDRTEARKSKADGLVSSAGRADLWY